MSREGRVYAASKRTGIVPVSPAPAPQCVLHAPHSSSRRGAISTPKLIRHCSVAISSGGVSQIEIFASGGNPLTDTMKEAVICESFTFSGMTSIFGSTSTGCGKIGIDTAAVGAGVGTATGDGVDVGAGPSEGTAVIVAVCSIVAVAVAVGVWPGGRCRARCWSGRVCDNRRCRRRRNRLL
jgi:hypothetical protein